MKKLELGAIADVQITNHFESEEAATRFHAQYPEYGDVKVGPPDYADDEILMTDEHGRFVIVKKIHTRQ